MVRLFPGLAVPAGNEAIAKTLMSGASFSGWGPSRSPEARFKMSCHVDVAANRSGTRAVIGVLERRGHVRVVTLV
ncbi:hypothetical protein [Sinorhizobium fredii]|uniref:hypothetical protein n=1 Tax=Rhizobium fredii TaxID=380 RepID=UPI0002FEE490|nr:hypothetical protein [Sinorhizobium fredii]